MIRSWVLGNEAHENRNGVLFILYLFAIFTTPIMKGVMDMSIHSEVSDNSAAKSFIENLCKQRWESMNYPCKGCKYRYPIKDDSGMCCIFSSIPKDWSLMEKRP